MSITDALFDAQESYSSNTRNCSACGGEFAPKNKNSKCCSRKCANSLSQIARSANSAARKMRTCEQCGIVFKEGVLSSKQLAAGHRQKYCGRVCYADSKRIYADKAEAKKAGRDRKRKKELVWLFIPVKCCICGCDFLPKSKASKVCSAECGKQRDVMNRAEKKDCSPRECMGCKVIFTPTYGVKRTKFCSDGCCRSHNKRVHKDIRKRTLKAATVEAVDPYVVFAAYKWKCYLCGASTPKSLRAANDNRSPELDHIIPLSKGGDHSYANTALACRKCNQQKSDKIYQLL